MCECAKLCQCVSVLCGGGVGYSAMATGLQKGPQIERPARSGRGTDGICSHPISRWGYRSNGAPWQRIRLLSATHRELGKPVRRFLLQTWRPRKAEHGRIWMRAVSRGNYPNLVVWCGEGCAIYLRAPHVLSADDVTQSGRAEATVRAACRRMPHIDAPLSYFPSNVALRESKSP